MTRVSKSTYREWSERRCREIPCDICQGDACETHHIARGSNRQRALMATCATLHLCKSCHDLKVHQGMSLEEQLAWLYFRRPHEFDLKAFWELCGRIKPTNQEVWKWVKRIRAAADVL